MDYPPLGGLASWYLYLLQELGYQCAGQPYSLSEVSDWGKLRGTCLPPWEVESVHLLSKIWVAFLSPAEPAERPPYETQAMSDQRRQRATEAMLANRKARKVPQT